MSAVRDLLIVFPLFQRLGHGSKSATIQILSCLFVLFFTIDFTSGPRGWSSGTQLTGPARGELVLKRWDTELRDPKKINVIRYAEGRALEGQQGMN